MKPFKTVNTHLVQLSFNTLQIWMYGTWSIKNFQSLIQTPIFTCGTRMHLDSTSKILKDTYFYAFCTILKSNGHCLAQLENKSIVALTLLASNYENCSNTNYALINAADLNCINMIAFSLILRILDSRDLEMKISNFQFLI